MSGFMDTAEHGRRWAGILLAAAVLTLYGYRQVWLLAAPPPGSRDRNALGRIHAANDFKHLYLGAKILRLGESPYNPDWMRRFARQYGVSINPYVYLPFTAQAMAPLTSLSLRAAIEVWFGLNHLMTLAALAVMATMWPQRLHVPVFALLVGAAAMAYPLTRTLTAGQLNCALLLALAIYWAASERDRPWVAGGALAFAALFKIVPAVLILAPLMQRRWKLLAATGVWLAALLSLSAASCGMGRYLEFAPVARDMGYGRSTWADVGFEFYRDPFNQSLNAFFHRAFAQNPTVIPYRDWGPRFANAATWAATLALLAIGMTALGWGRLAGLRRRTAPAAPPADCRAETPARRELDLALAILLMLLAPSLYWDHYGVLLVLPLVLIARHRPGWMGWTGIGLAVALTAAPQGFFMYDVAPRLPLGAALYSMQLWATLIVFAVAVALRLRAGATVPETDAPVNPAENADAVPGCPRSGGR